MELQILPLAITMMVGPQIISAIILVTSPKAVRASLAFLGGVLVATTLGVTVARVVARLFGKAIPVDGESPTAHTVGLVIQIALVVVLLLLALRTYLTRETAKPPKWLGALMTASPATAAKTGLLVIFAMPSDIVVMLTVGTNLEHHDLGLSAAIPFIAATVLIAALPLLAYLLFRKRAASAMPLVRDWMNSHSWLINMIACLIFVVIIGTSG